MVEQEIHIDTFTRVNMDQNIRESMPKRIKATLNVNGDLTQCKECVPNKVASDYMWCLIHSEGVILFVSPAFR